ncbi:FG-GAP repeat domain-containing protein [Saccharopolyspora sp. NPDC002376]
MDNDGWLDLVTGVSVADGTKPAIFRHEGLVDGVPQFATPHGLLDERTPTPETSQWENAGLLRYWPTGVNADFNQDGLIDMFAAEWFPELPSRYWQNTTSEAGRFIDVEVTPDHNALGATVNVYRLRDPKRGAAPIFSRQVLSTESYGGGALRVQHVGLGLAALVEVEVIGPAPEQKRVVRYANAGETVKVGL